MSATDKISAKEIIIALVVLVAVGIAMYFTIGVFKAEGVQKSVVISDKATLKTNFVDIKVQLLSFDPIKGDASTRITFEPQGSLISDEGSVTQDLKFFVNSANGKQEIDFNKGKRMTPVEAVIPIYEGNAADYPFDEHKAQVELYLTPGKPAEKKPDAKPAAATHEGDGEAAAPKNEEDALEDIPINVDWFGSLPGYTIKASNSKESDENYVLFDVGVDRSNVTVFFSVFVTVLMWALSLAVLFLMISVLFRGRKAEIAMFSFMAALLFAFYAVRNSQPNVPPIGVMIDFLGFFWAEIIVGACLLAGVFTWVLRSNK